MGLLSMLSFLMQPTKSLFLTRKSSGRLGTPPSNSGPVRSRDLQMAEKMKGREIRLLYFKYSICYCSFPLVCGFKSLIEK